MEEWRDVVGQEGRYQISSEGRVRSHRSLWWARASYRVRYDENLKLNTDEWRERKTQTTPLGYKVVLLVPAEGVEKRGAGVHRLVAMAFLGEPPADGQKWEVNHKNHVRDDNRVENLEWMTLAENRRNRKRGTNPYQVLRDRVAELEAQVVELDEQVRRHRRARGLPEEREKSS